MRRNKVAQPVTTVRRSPKEDRDQRMRSYLLAMAVRTVSFPLAVWALASGWIAVGLVLAAAATFLPQIAVTIANAIDHRTSGGVAPASPARALPQSPGDRAPGHPPHDIPTPDTPHGTPSHDAPRQDGPDAHL